MKLLKKLRLDTAGVTAIEYGLIIGLISVAGIAALNGMSDQINSTFYTTSSTMASN